MTEETIADHDLGFAGLRMLDRWPVWRSETSREIRPRSWKEMIMDVNDGHLLFAGMYGAAVFALAEIFVAVELLEEWRQVAHDALQFHFCAMHKLMTILAVPLEAVERSFGPRHLNYHADCSRL